MALCQTPRANDVYSDTIDHYGDTRSTCTGRADSAALPWNDLLAPLVSDTRWLETHLTDLLAKHLHHVSLHGASVTLACLP